MEGIRWAFLGDAKPLGLRTGLPGGVTNLSPLKTVLSEGELESSQ